MGEFPLEEECYSQELYPLEAAYYQQSFWRSIAEIIHRGKTQELPLIYTLS